MKLLGNYSSGVSPQITFTKTYSSFTVVQKDCFHLWTKRNTYAKFAQYSLNLHWIQFCDKNSFYNFREFCIIAYTFSLNSECNRMRRKSYYVRLVIIRKIITTVLFLVTYSCGVLLNRSERHTKLSASVKIDLKVYIIDKRITEKKW